VPFGPLLATLSNMKVLCLMVVLSLQAVVFSLRVLLP